MTDEKSLGKTEQMRAFKSDVPVVEIKMNRDFSKRLLLNNTVYLTDVVPIEQLLHAADRIIGNDAREAYNPALGYRSYSVETMNAVELIRKAMTNIIHDLSARTMPDSREF